MTLAGVAHHLRPCTGQRRADHLVAEGRLRDSWTEEVRRSPIVDVQRSSVVRFEEFVGHLDTGARFRRCGVGWEVLGDGAAARRAVGVQVLEHDEPRTGDKAACIAARWSGGNCSGQLR